MLSTQSRIKLLSQFRKIVCLVCLTAYMVCVLGGFRLFSQKTANTRCVSNHLSVLTRRFCKLCLLAPLLNEPPPLHQENPCHLAQIFLSVTNKTPCLSIENIDLLIFFLDIFWVKVYDNNISFNGSN